MTRELGQRQLVYELKHAIDRCRRRRRPWLRIAFHHLDTLIEENPRGVQAAHVRYNIGVARREWLDDYMARSARVRGPLPSPRDPASLELQ